MQVANSIQKARERKIDDSLIFQEIRKQNPQKEPFFKKAKDMGATATQILDEIIKQNPVKKETTLSTEVPPSTSPTPSIETVEEKKHPAPTIKKTAFEIETNAFSAEKNSPLPLTPETPSINPVIQKKENLNNIANSMGKTILTKEAQQREEEMRSQFLRRIEAKEKGENIESGEFFSPPLPSSETMQNGKINNNGYGSKITTTKILVFVVITLFILAVVLLFFSFL